MIFFTILFSMIRFSQVKLHIREIVKKGTIFFREIDGGIVSSRSMAFLHRTEINDGEFTNLNRESRVFSSAVHLKNLEVSFLFSKNEPRTLKSIAQRNNATKTLNIAALLLIWDTHWDFRKGNNSSTNNFEIRIRT